MGVLVSAIVAGLLYCSRGVPVVARDRRVRMEAIAEWLSSADYDFVFLEEVWLKSDYALIRDKTEKAYPFAHYFYR